MDDLYLLVIIKLIISFTILISYMSFIGKTQLTQLTAIDFIGNFILGAVVGGSIYNTTLPLIQFTLLLLMSVMCMLFINMLSKRFIAFRKLAIGESIVIIKNGRFVLSEIERKKRKIDMFRILSQLHCMGFHSFQEVYYAEVQPDGLLAAIKDSSTAPSEIFIHQGSILQTTIEEYDFKKEDIEGVLGHHNIDLKDVFIAEYYGETLYITLLDQKTRRIALSQNTAVATS